MKYIKLFEQEYSMYDIITMTPGMASEVLIDEICNPTSDIELIKNIIQHSQFEVNNRDTWNKTALMWATQKGMTDIVSLLLQILRLM